jgi:transketolase N-terminal domain/subunit
MVHQTRDIKELERIANVLRMHIAEMEGVGQRGHLGGSCSAADIAACALETMKQAPQGRKRKARGGSPGSQQADGSSPEGA